MAENRDRGIDPNSTEAIGDLLKELVWKIDRLKTLYEQYFMGIEKMEPMVARKEIQRAMLQLQQIYIRNTGLRFKFNTMLQKWNIYTTYWNRTLREIENGTYIRHIQKAKRAAEREGKTLPDEIAKSTKQQRALARVGGGEEAPAPRSLDVDTLTGLRVNADDLDMDIEKALSGLEWVEPTAKPAAKPAAPAPAPASAAPAARPAPPAPPPSAPARRPEAPPPKPAPPAAARPAPPPSPAAAKPPAPAQRVAGMDEAELRELHQRYVAARRATGETEVRFETLVNSLAKSGKEGVRFDVQVQNGRAVVKAIKKK